MTAPDGLEQLMDVQQLAEMFRIAPSTFSTWRKRGQGPRGFKLGRRLVYKRSDVETWLRDHYDATGKGGDQ